MKSITGFRLRRSKTEAKRQDNFTPVFFATVFTVFFEVLLFVFLHADPEMHLLNYALAGLVAFGAVAVATDANVNG
ncbi:hypothetical protein [Candidatus Burkholderia verschuerenii]|uniref:hypothetical protein n=1 Tax=Candidatus Burkholderia verschuerenii TaxID=242163 RepID=UPI000B08ECDF|nr:hypothetical protein [Candidatus Burkholderia verschuerenii]